MTSTPETTAAAVAETSASRMRKRMETPIGDRPAARVVTTRRSVIGSNRVNTKNTTGLHTNRGYPISRMNTATAGATSLYEDTVSNQKKVFDENYDDDESDNDELKQRITLQQEQDKLIPVVGEIVEKHKSTRGRKIYRRNKYGNTRQNLDNENNNNKLCISKTSTRDNSSNEDVDRTCIIQTGFPSLHVPLGTFVTNGNRSNMQNTTNGKKISAPGCIKDDINSSVSSIESLRRASQQDADSLLRVMTIEEIESNKSQLANTLSPQVIEFLTKRKKNAVTTNVSNKQFSVSTVSLESSANNEATIIDKELDGKIRLTEILTSIRTYDDLDNAYEAEMNRLEGMIPETTIGTNRNDNYHPQLPPISVVLSDESKIDYHSNEKVFSLACTLLRSTSFRQKLWAVKVVSQKLHSDVYIKRCRFPPVFNPLNVDSKHQTLHERSDGDWPYEETLIVSLRCLLDEPSVSSAYGFKTTMLIYSYALQSIYYLLLLRSPIDHVINVRGSDWLSYLSPTMMAYQFYYVDDTIYQRSSSDLYPASVMTVNINNDANLGVYAAGSSSSVSTAADDAKAFLHDPLWTMLIKMKILPRLEQIIDWHVRKVKVDIPTETVESICGILSMICSRVPNAATAILQQKSLVPELKEMYFPTTNTRKGNPVSLLLFLITASRQSRSAMQMLIDRIDLEAIILQILGSTSSVITPPTLIESGTRREEEKCHHGLYDNQECVHTYKLTLVLWRIMLRYGMGLSMLPKMMSLAEPHITLGSHDVNATNDELHTSLAIEWYSSFTVIAQCAYAIQLAKGTGSNEVNHTLEFSITNESSSLTEDDDKHSFEALGETLLQSLICLSSPRQHALNNLLTLLHVQKFQSFDLGVVKYVTSIMRFLDALHKVAEVSASGSSDLCLTSFGRDGHRTDDSLILSSAVKLDLCNCFMQLIQTQGIADVLDVGCRFVTCIDFNMTFDRNDSVEINSTTYLIREASACAFIESLLCLVTTLRAPHSSNNCIGIDDGLSIRQDCLRTTLCEILLQSMQLHATADNGITDTKGIGALTQCQSVSFDMTRRHWINMMHFAISTFLLQENVALIPKNRGVVFKQTGLGIGLTLLGRLERGDERVVAILSSVNIVDVSGSDVASNKNGDTEAIGAGYPSPLSLLLKELCRTPESRRQLDHSYRLNGRPGIVSYGQGPFRLRSLLNDSGTNDCDQSLPFGKYWLWKLLSGKVDFSSDPSRRKVVVSDTILVLRSVLQLIKELESCTISDNEWIRNTYANRLNVGAKMFHLLNVSLLPEDVIEDGCMQAEAENLFDIYCFQFHCAHDLRAFIGECSEDSAKANFQSKRKSSKEDFAEAMPPLTAHEAKTSEILYSSGNYADNDYSNHDIRSLITFLGDICDVYLEYGYQYRFCTKVVRFFLMKWIPNKVRCEAIKRLGDVLHLLSLEDDIDAVPKTLNLYLCGGRPSVDMSYRDSSDLLDAVSRMCSLLRKGAEAKPFQGFLQAFCVGIMSRSLVASLDFGGPALVATKRRMSNHLRDNLYLANLIIEAASKFVTTTGTLQDLVNVTNQVCFSPRSKLTSHLFEAVTEGTSWDDSISLIQECLIKK